MLGTEVLVFLRYLAAKVLSPFISVSNSIGFGRVYCRVCILHRLGPSNLKEYQANQAYPKHI